MAKTVTIGAGDVFLVVDVQNDFCPGGRLPVPHGDEVVAPINQIARCFEHVVLTQDWHPAGHHSFASSHQGCKPYDTVQARYGAQMLWPDHCIQDTHGARLHADLHIPHAELILRKGFRTDIDSYSAFVENDRKTPTGLAGYLHERGFSRVFLAGLAMDYCVRFSAEDARNKGFTTAIFVEACRALGGPDTIGSARRSFAERGIETIETSAVLSHG